MKKAAAFGMLVGVVGLIAAGCVFEAQPAPVAPAASAATPSPAPVPTPLPTPTPTATPTPRPISGVNLLPLAPQGWESPLIISSIPGARQSGPVAVGGPVYISFSVGNRGSDATPSQFFADILFDGVVVHRARFTPLEPRYIAWFTDWADLKAMVRLTPGKHRVRLVVDPTNLVAENDKADNVLEREVEWTPPAAPPSVTPTVTRKPNLAPFQIKGWDGVIVAASAQESISSASARSGPLSVDATTYISYGLKNVGLTSIGVPFWVYTYLDGVLVDRARWDGLPSDAVTWRGSISTLGQTVRLAPGPHTVRVEVDATNLIDESNENDNVFERPFLWGVGPVPTRTPAPPTPTPTPEAQTPFTFQYPLNDSNIGFFTENDTIETLLAASPFYAGAQPLPSQRTSQYDTARAKKVDEIKWEADSLARAVLRVKPRLDDVRTAYLSYLATVLREKPRLNDFAQKTFGQIGALASKEAKVEGEYNGIQTAGVTNAYAKAFMDYLKVVKAVELGSLYLQDANNLAVYAALALEGLGSSQNATIKQANAQLDKDMQGLDGMRPDLLAVASSMQKIDYGLRQLSTGNYYFSLATNDFIAASLPDLKAKVASLAPREGLTADDIQAIKAYLALLEKWQSQVKQATDSLDPSRRIKVSLRREAEGYLYLSYNAEPEGNYASAVASLSAPLQADEASNKKSGYFTKGWSGVKTVYNQLQLGAGLTVDTLKIAVDAGVNATAGLYYGNTPSDIWRDVKKDASAVVDNLNKGVSGVETLKTAEDYFQKAEDVAGQVGGKLVGGEGWSSWLVGGVAKLTVGMFTGLGNGVYKLANTQSTPQELAQGAAEVGLSLVGGSKIVIKGSQVPGLAKGLAEEANLSVNSFLAYMRSVFAEKKREKLTKEMADLFKNAASVEDIDKYVSNRAQLRATEALLKELQQSLKLTTGEMARLAKEGIAAKWQSSKNELAKSMHDALKEQYQRDLDG